VLIGWIYSSSVRGRLKRPAPLGEPSSPESGDFIAIITGGSRGIGGACARGLAARGVHVVISYSRSEDQASEVVDAVVAAVGRIDGSVDQRELDRQLTVNYTPSWPRFVPLARG
jgi:hypothetical protein